MNTDVHFSIVSLLHVVNKESKFVGGVSFTLDLWVCAATCRVMI